MWLAGGNVDDRRIGIGASMYYPVAVEGGLVSMGDAHSAQGDSEFDGEMPHTVLTPCRCMCSWDLPHPLCNIVSTLVAPGKGCTVR